MPNIQIKDLSKIYTSGSQKITALDNINLVIEAGKYHTLLGPSGCGKTTLLRTIAGLTAASKGMVMFDGKDVTGLPAQNRDIGFVFQQFAIFPHFDVWDNTAYGPVVKGWPTAEALATKSKLLLLDEPLSALDAKIGEFLRYELKDIVKNNQITAIHVTHNQEEAMTISDNIILMKKGRIVQAGTPEELYENPGSIFSANFIGKCNFFTGERISDNTINFNHKIHFKRKINSRRVVVGVRPEKIQLEKTDDGKRLPGKIKLINFLGYLYEYLIECNGETVRAYKRIKEYTIKNKFKTGEKVFLWFNPEDTFAWPEPKDFKDELSPE
jgi:ABC-type Fe3+/spermidine/putrescine transport system ATPase subunit